MREKKMKIMISQPMRGRSNKEILEERQSVIDYLQTRGHEVINTVFDIDDISEYVSLRYLSKSIEAMSQVEAVIFMPGWENARGCRIEHQAAKEYGKFIKYL